MTLAYLLDEHVAHALGDELLAQAPPPSVRVIGGGDAPAPGTPDPALLEWCEREGFILVTNNRRTMPAHLANQLARSGRVPGIFIVKDGWTLAETAQHLVLVAGASPSREYENQVWFLPVV